MDPIDRAVGLRIRRRREELGLSQDELARRLDIKVHHLCRYEDGSTAASAARLRKLGQAMDVTLEYFFDFPVSGALATLEPSDFAD